MDQVLEKVHYYLMPRYQILVEYAGSNFRGWQVQKKGKTVQGLIQEKISKLLKEKIIIYGAGRLDSGVHAEEQSAHFDYNIEIKKKEGKINWSEDAKNINGKINGFCTLPTYIWKSLATVALQNCTPRHKLGLSNS